MTHRFFLILSLVLLVGLIPIRAEEDEGKAPEKLSTNSEDSSEKKADSNEGDQEETKKSEDEEEKEEKSDKSADEASDKAKSEKESDESKDSDKKDSDDKDSKKDEKSKKKDDKPAQEFKPLWMKPGKYFQGRKKADDKPALIEMHGQVLSSWVQRMQKVTYVAWKEQTVLTRTKNGQSKETLGLAFFRSEKGTCYITPAEPKSLKFGSYYMIVPGVEEVTKNGQKVMRRQRQDLGQHPWAKEMKCTNAKRVLIAIGAFDLKAAWE